MNIFVIDQNPRLAAQQACDQHVVKMVTETGQLLCTAWPLGSAPYKHSTSQFSHPAAVWARASRRNFEWLLRHGQALAKEYTFRFQRRHASEDVIDWCAAHYEEIDFAEKRRRTPFPKLMPDEFKIHSENGTVDSYRSFYIGDKSRFARWGNGRPPPSWWPFGRQPTPERRNRGTT